MDYAALLNLIPDPYRSIVYAILQFLAALTLVIPAIEKIAKLTKTDKDDKALSTLARILSMVPRVQIPALSQRPPAAAPTAVKIDAGKWPTPEQLVTPRAAEAPKSTVIVPPADPKS